MRFNIDLLVAVTSILFGSAIYLLFRPTTLEIFDWLEALGLLEIILDFRKIGLIGNYLFADWIIYSLPTGLWVLSGMIGLFKIWSDYLLEKVIWSSFFSSSAILLEVSQLFNFMPGTFDKVDLIVILISIFVSLSFSKKIMYEIFKKTS